MTRRNGGHQAPIGWDAAQGPLVATYQTRISDYGDLVRFAAALDTPRRVPTGTGSVGQGRLAVFKRRAKAPKVLRIVLVTEHTLGVTRNYPLKTPFPGSVLNLSTRSSEATLGRRCFAPSRPQHPLDAIRRYGSRQRSPQ